MSDRVLNDGADVRTALEALLKARGPTLDLSSLHASHACVSILLRGKTLQSLEIGFIRRSIAAEDRWSGHVGFPGGRAEISDPSDFATACRETLEEIGVDLTQQELLAPLDDLRARNRDGWLDFYVRPFVFLLEKEIVLRLDAREVADFFWIPISELRDPSFATFVTIEGPGGALQFPGIRVKGDPPLWGLTLQMTQDLLARLGQRPEN